MSIDFSASSFARGGHFRRCGQCISRKCFIVNPTYTNAHATASASVTADITFNNWLRDRPYRIRVIGPSSQGAPSLRYTLVNAQGGAPLLTETSERQSALVSPTQGAAYRLLAWLDIESRNDGLCCPGRGNSGGLLSIDVAPAGWIEGVEHMYEPYIVRGTEEFGYEGVGLIRLKESPGSIKAHCTGALVGPRTVLTAAHCVYNESRPMVFSLGTFPDLIPGPTFEVDGKPVYPVPGSGLAYDHNEKSDDVALIYLKEPPEISTRYALHRSAKPMEVLKSERTKLVFIGYGASNYGDGKFGIGVKRRLELAIDSLGAKTFINDTLPGNTCFGDSGGPAFAINDQGIPEIVGIVSRGDRMCVSHGVNTRVDYVAGWVRSRIQ